MQRMQVTLAALAILALPGAAAAHHDGLRYLFPSVEERDMFLASPERFIRIQDLRTAE